MKFKFLAVYVIFSILQAQATQICGVSVSREALKQLNTKGEITGSVDRFTGTVALEPQVRTYVSLVALNPESLAHLEVAARYKEGVKTLCLRGSLYSENNYSHVIHVLEAKF